MLPMILIPNHGHNSAAKLINSYLIRNFYALYFPLISVFNFEGSRLARMIPDGKNIIITPIDGIF